MIKGNKALLHSTSLIKHALAIEFEDSTKRLTAHTFMMKFMQYERVPGIGYDRNDPKTQFILTETSGSLIGVHALSQLNHNIMCPRSRRPESVWSGIV